MREQDLPIVHTYALALADVADRSEVPEAVFSEAQRLRRVMSEHPRFLRLLERPAISKEEKKNLIRKVFEGSFSVPLVNLGLLLIDKNRGGLWDEILDRYIALIEERSGIHSGELRTARALSDDEKKRLQKALERFTQTRLRITFREDPRLIGGVRFQYQDVLIDNTLRKDLKHLSERLHAVKVD